MIKISVINLTSFYKAVTKLFETNPKQKKRIMNEIKPFLHLILSLSLINWQKILPFSFLYYSICYANRCNWGGWKVGEVEFSNLFF